MPVDCVLHEIVKNSKFRVWNDFQFCLIAGRVDRGKKTHLAPLCANRVIPRSQTFVHRRTDGHEPFT